jgi:uncharacterized protein (DUF58 family)
MENTENPKPEGTLLEETLPQQSQNESQKSEVGQSDPKNPNNTNQSNSNQSNSNQSNSNQSNSNQSNSNQSNSNQSNSNQNVNQNSGNQNPSNESPVRSRGKKTETKLDTRDAFRRFKFVVRWWLIAALVGGLLYLLWTRLSGASALLWLLPLAMVLLAGNLYYRRRPALEIKRIHPTYATAGNRVAVRLECTITAPLPLRLHFSDVPPRTLILGKSLELGGIFFGEQQHTLESEIRVNMRGEYVWPGFKVYWADPWGLFWWEMELDLSTNLIVFPDKHAMLLPEMLRPLLADGRPGARIGLEDPSSLRGIREYQAGDALNRIHWRQTAKYAFTGVPMVRELERVSSASLHLHIDTFGSERFLESAVKLASSIVRLAEAEYQSIQISTSSQQSTFGRGSEALISALTVLARVQHHSSDTRSIPLPAFGANLIVITERPHLELVEQALKARAKASRVLLLVIHEGFYLEPTERPRRIWAGLHETVQQLEQRAAILSEHGIRVFLLRGNQSVLELSGREG